MNIKQIYQKQGIDPSRVTKYMNLSHIFAQLAENCVCIVDSDLRKYTNYRHEWGPEIGRIRKFLGRVLVRAEKLEGNTENAFFDAVSHFQDISEILTDKHLSEEDYVRIKALLTNYKPVNK